MANVNLTKYYTNKSTETSNVDSKIAINTRKPVEVRYADLKLDLDFNELIERPLNAKVTSRDLLFIKNEESIINSLRNIMNTFGGSRILNPEINFNLRSYLFEPLTTSKAFFLGYNLSTFIPYYEPRVTIKDVEIEINYNDSSYEIQMTIGIPDIEKDYKISSVLSKDSYSIDFN